jgi:bifunctional DNA-binding transcriptional regulator/antitoxin component of YhaV-PrlF toxin-antitoxin module
MAKPKNEPRYEVITHEDENGDLVLPIPPELLNRLGWKEGDTLDFKLDEKGRWILQKI